MAANPTKAANKRASPPKPKPKTKPRPSDHNEIAERAYSSTSNRATPTNPLTGCAPSANSKLPDLRSAQTLAGVMVALIQRGDRELSWASRDGCVFGGSGSAVTLDRSTPRPEFRKTDRWRAGY